MIILYGCECVDGCKVHLSHNQQMKDRIPVAYLVFRDGKEMKVCTRCILSTDQLIAKLFDDDTDAKPFVKYDTLGSMKMMFEIEDSVDEVES